MHCNAELAALQEFLPGFRELGASLVAISPQLAEHGRALLGEQQLEFPLLVDRGNEVARRYGVVFTVPEPQRAQYRALGLDLTLFNGDGSWTLPMPARFLIDPDGIVRHAAVHPDHTHRLDPRSTLAALRALLSHA